MSFLLLLFIGCVYCLLLFHDYLFLLFMIVCNVFCLLLLFSFTCNVFFVLIVYWLCVMSFVCCYCFHSHAMSFLLLLFLDCV